MKWDVDDKKILFIQVLKFFNFKEKNHIRIKLELLKLKLIKMSCQINYEFKINAIKI